MTQFNGLGLTLGNLARLSKARTHSINPENPDCSVAAGARALMAQAPARRDDIASVTCWYQDAPNRKLPPLPDVDELEVI
jgi:hypothetical protein